MFRNRKSQSGFAILEFTAIILILGVLGLVGWMVFKKTTRPHTANTSASPRPTALLYANFDNLSLKVNRYDLVSGQNKQLFEQNVSEPDTRARPFTVLHAQVSTDKRLVAYRFGGNDKIRVIKGDGTTVREVPRSDVASFTWLQNKRKLVLEVSNYVNCNGVNCEAPINGFGSDWYIYDIDTGKETKLNTGNNSFNRLQGQTKDTLYFAANSPYGGVSPKFYAYDILSTSHAVTQVGLPVAEGIQIGFISTSPSSKHTIISILQPGFGTDNKCTIYELNGTRLGAKLVNDANYQCENAEWVNDDEFYFDKSTVPNGTITTSDNSPSAYYVLLSVFKYSYLDMKQEKILASDGSEVYRLMASLPGGSLVISNEANKRNPEYKLEIRNPDGSLKTIIGKSQKEMLFIGAVE